MKRTRVKICGVRDRDTALAAIDAGADALGFVFAPRSPRSIAPEAAWSVVSALPPFVASVGVFVDATADEYAEAGRVCPTDYGQLHGNENEALVRECGPRVIKAVRFDAATIEAQLLRWSGVEEVDAILIDGSAGGEGAAFDCRALARIRGACRKPLIIAGGLTPANVGDAIRTVRPFAVDVSSGVESAPGEKDRSLIRAFCGAVRSAAADLE